MCGIIGMMHYRSNGFDVESRNALIPMLLLNSLRGSHSTGLLGIQSDKKEDKVHFVKRIGSPYSLLNEPEGKKFLDKVFGLYNVVIGHGRYATTGDVTAANAHPFIHDHISLVHNGSVRNLWDIKVEGKSLHNMFDVDSEALAFLFAKEGAKRALKEVTGAFSLLWHDAKERCVFAARNSERPLHLVVREDIPGIFFSSEAETLRYVAEKFPQIKLGQVLYLEPDHLYKFPIYPDKIENKWSREKITLGKVWSGRGWKNNEYWDSKSASWKPKPHTDFQSYGEMSDLFDYVPELSRMQRDSVQSALLEPLRKDEKVIYLPNKKKTLPQLVAEARDVKSKLSSVKVAGINLKLGQKIAFFPTDVEEIVKNTWYIQGYHVTAQEVACASHWKGKAAPEFKGDAILVGKIEHLTYLKPEKSAYKLRAFLSKLERISSHVEDQILNKELIDLETEMIKYPWEKESEENRSAFLRLKDGESVSVFAFEVGSNLGCARCNESIDITDAPQCLSTERISLKYPSLITPEERKHGGYYCPTCVIHRLAN